MTTDEGAAATPVPAGRPPHRVRNLLLIVGAFVLVLGGVTGGVLAFLAFDKATSIDRSTPQVVTEQFLDATLVSRDAARVALFICSHWSAADALADARPPIDVSVSVSWGDFVTTVNQDEATVVVGVQFSATVNGVTQRLSERWTLNLSDEGGGWRVCGLVKE